LDEEDQAAGVGDEVVFDVGVWVEDHGSGAVDSAADVEFAFEDVRDLREVVAVEGVAGARVVADETGIRFGRIERRQRYPARRLPVT